MPNVCSPPEFPSLPPLPCGERQPRRSNTFRLSADFCDGAIGGQKGKGLSSSGLRARFKWKLLVADDVKSEPIGIAMSAELSAQFKSHMSTPPR